MSNNNDSYKNRVFWICSVILVLALFAYRWYDSNYCDDVVIPIKCSK